MIVNKSSIAALFVSLNAIFNKSFMGVKPNWERIAMRVPSSAASEDYGWLADFPKMRRWVGDKMVKALRAYNYVIKNDDFEATISVKRNDLEDDTLGKYSVQANSAGISAAEWPNDLVGEAVAGMFTLPCYDGQYFCDTDHPVYDAAGNVSSVSNKTTTALSISTQAAAIASFGAAKTAMQQFKDDNGRTLGVVPDVLMVGPALEDTAKALMTADRLEDGKANLYKGACEVVVRHELTGNQWALLDTTKPVKPFLFQERKKPVFVNQVNMDSDNVFMRGEYRFGAEARGNSGFGFWQLCYGSTGAG